MSDKTTFVLPPCSTTNIIPPRADNPNPFGDGADGKLGWDYKVALSSVATSTLSFGMGLALEDSSDSMKLLVKTLIESPLSTLISAGIQGKDIKLKDITMGMIEKFATTLAQQEVDKGKREREMKERQNSLPPGGDFDGMLGLLFGGMFAAAARRESADPGDAAAGASGTGDSAGGPQNLVAYDQFAGHEEFEPGFEGQQVETTNWQDILDPFGVDAGSLFGGNGVEPFDLSVLDEAGDQTVYEENQESCAETPAGDTIEENHETQFSSTEEKSMFDIIRESDPNASFHDGSAQKNPYTADYLKSIYPNLTTEQIDAYIKIISDVAQQPGTAGIFNNDYKELCRYVVDNFASGTQTPPIVTPPIVQPIPTVKQPVAQSIPTVTQQNNQNNNTNSVPPWMQILLNFAAPAAGSLLNQALQNGSNNISPTQQKIVDNLKDIRGKTQTIVEQGSIHLANGGGKDPINNNLRFTGDKLDSFKKINSELSKSPAYKNMPYYLQQEISNNMSNYVVRLMATAEGSKELKEWMKANGKTASSYSEYNKLAIDYALEQMKPLADDVTKKYADLKAQGKTDKEILDTLIKDKAGKGLIDLGSYRDEIEKNGIFNPYTISSKFEYRDYRGGEVHYGIDTTDGGYATGRMIQTPLGGKIEFIGEKIGYGKMVIIEHHSNLRSNLGHLAGIDENLKKDQQVSKGLTTIGEMGNTDRVDGTASGKVRIHLHHDMDYSLDGKTWDLGKTIKLNPTEFSADLQSYLKAGTGRSLETFMKSQEFKTHLTNLQTFLDTTASNHPDVKDYCDKQVKLIKQALAKFK